MAEIFANPLQSDSSSFLNATVAGEKFRNARADRNALMEAGQLAQSGDLRGAENAALGSGLLDAAGQFGNIRQSRAQAGRAAEDRQREQQLQALQLVSRVARGAETPEQYAAGIDVLENEFGFSVPDRFRDFANRDLAVDMVTSAADRLERAKAQASGDLLPLEERERRKTRGRELGKADVEAAVEQPKTVAKANRMLSSVDAALSDPAVERVTGPIQGSPLNPNFTGTAHRGQSRIDQLQGQAFLQAYQDLKGGGQITNIEGEKAENALARINTQGMRDEDYRDALVDLRDVAVKGLRRSLNLAVDDETIESLSNAREAIARGASREQVEQRLIENGIDPTGL